MQGVRQLRVLVAAPTALVALLMLASASPAAAKSSDVVGDFKYVKTKVSLAKAAGPAEKANDVVPSCDGQQWHVSGGGGYMGGPTARSYLSSTGLGGERKWLVSAWHTDAPKTKLTGLAVCTRNLSTVSDGDLASVGAAPGDHNSTFTCASGSVIGGGVRAIGLTTDWFINGTLPSNADAWQDYMRHRAGGSSSFIVDAVCVAQGVSPDYRQKSADLEASKSAKARAKCKVGHVTGGGAVISGTVSQAHIAGSYPVDGGDADKIPDDGWEARATNDTGSDKQITTYVICV